MVDRKLQAGEAHVLIWHYFSPEDYPAPTRGHSDIIMTLECKGLLSQDSNDIYRVTDMGQKYVDMMLATPFPVRIWADPRAVTP